MLNYELHKKVITLCLLVLGDLLCSQLNVRLLRSSMISLILCPFIFTISYQTPLYECSTIYFDSLVQEHLKCCLSVAITSHAADTLLLVPWEVCTRVSLAHVPRSGIIGDSWICKYSNLQPNGKLVSKASFNFCLCISNVIIVISKHLNIKTSYYSRLQVTRHPIATSEENRISERISYPKKGCAASQVHGCHPT